MDQLTTIAPMSMRPALKPHLMPSLLESAKLAKLGYMVDANGTVQRIGYKG